MHSLRCWGWSGVGVDDSFFALGGNSVMVRSLVERLRELGAQITVQTLYKAPTVAELIKQLDLASIRDALGVLFPIRAHGSNPPFFCVHPASGLSWCYLPLSQCVPADNPLYGLQARGLDGTGQPARSVRDMASDYIEQIRTVQGSGPYRLLGWSFGGIVVQEMAVQRAADQDLELVDMVNRLRQEGGYILAAISDGELTGYARIHQNNERIGSAHQPRRFEGNLLVVVATEDNPDGPSIAAMWKSYVSGEISESRLQCKHLEMMRPDLLAQTWGHISTWLKLPN